MLVLIKKKKKNSKYVDAFALDKTYVFLGGGGGVGVGMLLNVND